MYLTKRKDGAYIPSDDTSSEQSKKIGVGTEVKATSARNVKFHRKAFALLGMGYDNQTLIETFENYRKLKIVEAGYCDKVIDKYGAVHEFPHSLSFENMSAETFEKWYNATLEVLSRDMLTASETIRDEIDKFY